MAEAEMRRILSDLAARGPCLFARVIPSDRGCPSGGSGDLRGHWRAASRGGIRTPDRVLDRLKKDVPIWKRRAITGDESKASR